MIINNLENSEIIENKDISNDFYGFLMFLIARIQMHNL